MNNHENPIKEKDRKIKTLLNENERLKVQIKNSLKSFENSFNSN